MTLFWSTWICVLTLGSLIGLTWLLIGTRQLPLSQLLSELRHIGYCRRGRVGRSGSRGWS